MSDVSRGSVSSMPGSWHLVPDGTMCDHHPRLVATHRVQGETDSMGCEYVDMCPFCKSLYVAGREAAKENLGFCELCKSQAKGIRAWRDYDEGSCGRVYRVCTECRAKANAVAAEEYDDTYEDRLDYRDDFYD